MDYTGKIKQMKYNGRTLRLYNQSSSEWTIPYACPAIPETENDDLHTSGCGIFALAHLIDYCCGFKPDVESLAGFSVLKGGRGEDGTDRPVLLSAMEKNGRLGPYGIRYDGEGFVNDSSLLWETLLNGGAALCNLRVGHIVAVVDWRIVSGEKQVLIIDSSRDSIHTNVYADVRECVPGSEMTSEFKSASGSWCGEEKHYAMYWVPLAKPFDMTLLHRIEM